MIKRMDIAMNSNFSLKEQLLQHYDQTYEANGISGERLANRLDELSKIGLTKDHGSNRPGFSQEEKQAKELVMQWMKEAGLSVQQDGAGNVVGRLSGKNDALPAILSGSHVDSVPNGGHFDGVLGVLTALEVAQSWKETGYQPEKPFEVIIFSDEEGSRFNGGLNGSEAMFGEVNIEEKLKLQDAEGKSFEEVLEAVGLRVEGYEKASRNPEDVETFIEVHIEQGKQLEKEQLPCGIVTGIAGPCWLEVTFVGSADHAGNTPMNDRQDALVAASEFVSGVSELPGQVSDAAVATVGKLNVEPNGVNVVPGRVSLVVDVRDIQTKSRDELVDLVITLANEIAQKYGMTVELEENYRVSPVPIQEDMQRKLEQAVQANGIRPFKLPSGAAHDAMIVGSKVPVAMLLVQSKNGSHNPAEWMKLEDAVQTVQVLKTWIESLQQENK